MTGSRAGSIRKTVTDSIYDQYSKNMEIELDASMAELRLLNEQSAQKTKQIQDLRHERRDLDEQFEKQLLEHAQADCKRLTSMMHKKLPQELKELVYQYLYLEEAPIPIGSYHFSTYVPKPLRSGHQNPQTQSAPFIVVPEGSIRQDHSIERDDNMIYPDSWLLDPTYLGLTVAQDASKFYYQSNTFSVCTLDNAISDFLFRDPINNFTGSHRSQDVQPLGFKPIDHVRNIQIRVKYEHLTAYFSFYSELRNGEKDLMLEIFNTMHKFVGGIDSAAAAQLRVELLLMTDYKPIENELKRKRLHLNLLEAVRLPVYKLKHDLGVDLTVTHYDEYYLLFPRDVTDNFQLSQSQWSYEKAAFQKDGTDYSPSRFFISPGAETAAMEGFSFEHVMPLAKSRWGFDDAIRIACESVREGRYWPINEPVDEPSNVL